ncbi:hypothetical protein ACQ86G_26030 [Roseateles chitinivorans]|uniref:hypothetical protein n=1 Tax=Roseateles chitinivorans TaxID=2917965 RepID=UPI003D67A570
MHRGLAPGLDRALSVLDRHDPDAGRRLEAWCRVVLAAPAARDAASPAPWRDTRLNTRPEPVELSLGWPDDGLRATFDLAARAAAPPDRLAQALACVREADPAAARDGGALASFAALQRHGPLDWGAWLGVRWRADGTARAKVYAEVPRTAPPDELDRWLRARLGARPAVPPQARLLLVGATPGDALCECYFECPRGPDTSGSRDSRDSHDSHDSGESDESRDARGLHDWGDWRDWDRLLRAAGIDGEAQGLFPLMRRFDGREPRPERGPPAAWAGFSLAGTPDGRVHKAAVLATVARLAGGEAGLRRQILALVQRQGGALPLYDALTTPLRALHRADGFHNLLSCSAAVGTPAGWQIAFCPPPCLADAASPDRP